LGKLHGIELPKALKKMKKSYASQKLGNTPCKTGYRIDGEAQGEGKVDVET